MLSIMAARLTNMQHSPFLPNDGRNHHWYSLRPPWRADQAEWARVAWINTGMIHPQEVVTNHNSDWARRSLTLLMWPMPLPLCQTSLHTRWPKMAHFCTPYNFMKHWPIFKIFSQSESGKLVIVLSLKIPPYLKCVATLPCEMSMS